MNQKQQSIINAQRERNQELGISRFESIMELFEQADNYGSIRTTPLSVLIDLIGFVEEGYSEPLTPMNGVLRALGYHETDLLVRAIAEYIQSPDYACEFIRELLDADIEDEDDDS